MNLNLRSIFHITGLVFIVIGLSMAPAVLVSFICDETAVAIPFFLTMAVIILIGFILTRIFIFENRHLRLKDGFLTVTLCWLVSGLLGAVPFMTTGSIPNFADAFFESCSGFTTTGASILTDIEILPKGILFWRSFTHWIGGISILIFAIALMPSLGIRGQNIGVSESSGYSLEKITPKIIYTIRTLIFIYTLFTIAETILLMFGGLNLYDALLHSFGTVSTGGFSDYNDSIAYFDSTYVNMIITAFMFLCGINFNLYFLAPKRGLMIFIKNEEFRIYFYFLLGSSLLIFLMQILIGDYGSTGAAACDSLFQATSIMTTTGYTTANYEMWPVACQIILLMLMFIGGCSSSTGGGIKVIRILILLKLIHRGISTRLHPNAIETIKLNGRELPSDTVSAISSHMFLYVALIFAGAFIISFENQDLTTCFSSVISCLGNIGPGFGGVGPWTNFADLSMLSKCVLSVYMIAGMLELYTLFLLLTPRFWSSDR